MKISLDIVPGMEPGIHEIIRLFFPDAEILYQSVMADLHISISLHEEGSLLKIAVTLRGCLDGYGERTLTGEDRTETKRCIRCLVYEMLKDATGSDPSPYGILTGIRPTKLIHKMFDRGLTESQAASEISNKYLVRPKQAELLAEVAARNRAYLPKPEQTKAMVSVYIGIPYCPSRCSYCSFPGYPLGYQPGLDQYLEALLWELEITGETLHQKGITVENIYIGGGTPTVLDLKQWHKLLAVIHQLYIQSATREFTVEAGRPETVNNENLRIFKDSGVNRLCINPQTMNPATLQMIGRSHTVQDVNEAVLLARSAGFSNINMDLIVGLPGEGTDMFLHSLEKVMELAPEGITIHALARKRGSKMDMEGPGPGADNGENARESVDEAYQRLMAAGYMPYYLYRQKYMAGNLENIGYARTKYGLYNIQIIEERQTVLGMGSGSSSKFVDQIDWSLISMYHPKDPRAYVNNLKTLVMRQVDKLKALS